MTGNGSVGSNATFWRVTIYWNWFRPRIIPPSIVPSTRQSRGFVDFKTKREAESYASSIKVRGEARNGEPYKISAEIQLVHLTVPEILRVMNKPISGEGIQEELRDQRQRDPRSGLASSAILSMLSMGEFDVLLRQEDERAEVRSRE